MDGLNRALVLRMAKLFRGSNFFCCWLAPGREALSDGGNTLERGVGGEATAAPLPALLGLLGCV